MNKITKFLKEVQTELKKVVWPTRPQALRLTVLVVGVSLVVGLYIGVLDYVLTKIVEMVVR
jgi:preprotein translocase subunit SecE